jgi:hypothetical protein
MKRLVAILPLVFNLSLGPSAAGEDESPGKKGICMGGGGASPQVIEDRIRSLNVAWHYNWTPAWKGRELKGAPFVPMFFGDNKWSHDGLAGLKVAKSKADANPLLGFNEPDGAKQANMTVARALQLWPLLEKTNRRLGSPATVHADNEWMKDFMERADEEGLRVDFICVHWYGECDADKFLARLETIHGLYEKPIWITEFAPADWSAKSAKDNRNKPSDVLRFMKAVLPRLEKLKYVERYAWFTAKPDHRALGPAALFDENGALTELGDFYSGFGK